MNKFKFSLLLSWVLLFSTTLIAQTTMGYQNPVIRGFNPDPSVCRVGDDFYLVTSSFEYFPGLPIYKSKDLIHWEQIGHCLTRDSQLPLQTVKASEGLFAPSIRYHNGLFYVICTNVFGGGNFFCTTTDPAGEWSEPVWIQANTIDPDIFWDDDDTSYLVMQGAKGISVVEIDLNTGALKGDEHLVWDGIGGRFPEAPHIYKKDGYYYVLLGEGGTEYMHSATIGRSKNLFGPYESCPLNPILTHANRIGQGNPIQAVGHADLIQAADGSWWMVFLGFRIIYEWTNWHILGRETFLAPVDWPKNGWPQVNGNGTVTLDMPVETLPQYPVAQLPIRNNFDTDKLGFEWQYIRNPIRHNYSVTAKKGYLKISASPNTLNDIKPVSALCRRQTEHDFTATTLLQLQAHQANEEAGITVLQNNTHHYGLLLVKTNASYEVQLRVKIGSMNYVAARQTVDGDEVLLRVKGTPYQYTFYFAQPSTPDKFVELGSMDTRYLSKEVAGGFTGVMIGLFASSNGLLTKAAAYFDWFDYETGK